MIQFMYGNEMRDSNLSRLHEKLAFRVWLLKRACVHADRTAEVEYQISR